MLKSHIAVEPGGSLPSVGFIHAETAAMPKRGVAIVAIVYGNGTGEPSSLPMVASADVLRSTAALFLRTADAVEGKTLVKQ